MTEQAFVIRGDAVYSISPQELACRPQSYLLVAEGRIAGLAAELPPQWQTLPLYDYGAALLLPGMTDLHLHAPQFSFRGLGMDLPLLPWLERYTFPEEARYAEAAHAEQAYRAFAAELQQGFLTRAVVFATIHGAASLRLAQLLEQSGLIAFVGRVSMDRCALPALAEGPDALAAEQAWLQQMQQAGLQRVRPILTPRFVPSCSPQLLAGLGALAAESGLPVQSHLSESRDEVALVRELYPQSACYGAVYDRFGLFGQTPTVMAHCVYSDENEQELIQRRGVFVAHCPQSNLNLVSGAAPVREMLRRGLRIGLGSDIAGGAHSSPLRGIQDAIAVSKLRAALLEDSSLTLSFAEAFYLATCGGGAFFGQVGSLQPGYAADILVLDDRRSRRPGMDLEERLQRAVYLLDERDLLAKYIAGRRAGRLGRRSSVAR